MTALTLRRPKPRAPDFAVESVNRPVLLATLGVPFDDEAAAFAVDTAVESGAQLIVANCVELPPLPMSVMLGHDQIDLPEVVEAIRAPAQLAQRLGVDVERIRVKSLRPIEGLLELVAERRPGLVVFGPDRARVSRRVYRKACRLLRDRLDCLVWIAQPDPD
jgi:nucleotide-binding universal stress UspA family protein